MSQQSRTDGHPVTPRDHVVGLFQKRNDHAHRLIGDVTGEDVTRIQTRLPPSDSTSAVLTQRQNFVLMMTTTHILLRKLFAP